MSAKMYVVLTVADHDKNGFISLAKWVGMDEATARDFIAAIDAEVSDESEPDGASSFGFILDLMRNPNECEDTGKKILPLQIAMRIAPDQVAEWLDLRPEPDDWFYRAIPVLSLDAIALAGATP